MKRLAILPPVAAGLVLLLTYLLVQAATPDAALHERTLETVRALIHNDAALQRDVLRARAALLRNYDPLVESINGLRAAAGILRAGVPASGEDGATFERQVEGIAAAANAQEELVDVFKSKNALLQNSLTYFTHTSHRLSASGANEGDSLEAQVRASANAMLGFMNNPRGYAGSELPASLDRLAGIQAGEVLQADISALVAHGRIVLVTLPEVDEVIRRLLASSISDRARSFQDSYLEFHGQAAARAGAFRILLYVASLMLVLYIGYLFQRLRANARILRSRLEFENLIASISAQFINLPRGRIDDGINGQLARLAGHAGVDRAHIVTHGADETGIADSYLWHRTTIDASAPSPSLLRRREREGDDLIGVMLHWTLEDYRRQGCVHVPDVGALADSREKSHLQARGIRSWLCIPMWCAGKRVGFLALDTMSSVKHWADDDIALLRTAGEIFANAIERERSELERDMLEARLQQAQRLEAIGTLAGGIAHEFNNILGAIFGHAEMALSALGRDNRAHRHLQRILIAGERAKSVIKQILTFSRRSERRSGPVAAGPVVAEAMELLRASLPATLAIETKLGVGDATVLGDPTELQQVVMNLCTNAAHAMANHGTLEVALDAVRVDGDLALSHGNLPAGCYIRLTVSDTGHGIDAATLERILEPFFTTKAVGQGTGLGLSTVQGIVTRHGGALNIESRPGEGSTFQAYFPRAEGIARDREGQRHEASVPRGHGETVLIVDDDKPLVLLGEEMLAALGYEPVGFDKSPAALAAVRANPDRFDLVLTDELMPEMTGTELATALHEIRPDLPVFLMTGGPIRTHRLQAAGVRDVLKKPLLSATIAECLARHLSGKGSGRVARMERERNPGR